MKQPERDARDLAASTLFVFSLLASIVGIGAITMLVLSAHRKSRAKEAIAAWQSLPGRLTRLESFVRKSSFYYQVEISYRWQNSEKIFSESWIPSAWREEGVGEVPVGGAVTLFVDPNNPDRAMWNPQRQAERCGERIAKSKLYSGVGCVSCLAFLLVGRMAARKPKLIADGD